MSVKTYRRLPGARRGFVRRNSSWAADDHLLLIGGTRFQERYQRIFYRDVLGIVVERTRRFSAPWFWFLILFWTLIAGITISVTTRTVTTAGWVMLGGMSILVALHLLVICFGSCRVWIATDVGNLEAPGVMRRWQAKQFVTALQSRILAAQPSPAPVEAPQE